MQYASACSNTLPCAKNLGLADLPCPQIPDCAYLNGIDEDLGIGTFFGIRAKKCIIFDDMPCISNIRVWQDDIFEDLFTALVVECEDFGGFVGKIGDPFVFFGFGFGLAFE